MVEAVTARVSVLPVVGSDLPTGLSAVVGVTKQLVVDLSNTLDKVGHEKGEMDMPSRINGGRTSLQQEVDFDSMYRCPQKMRHALTAGPAVDQWDWRRIIELIKWFCKLLDIPKLAGSNGLRDLDRKYKLKLCVMTVQSRVQTPRTGPEISSYPRLKSNDGRSN